MISRRLETGGTGGGVGAGWTALPTAMFVPFKAETGIWPQTVMPLTATPVASAHAVPLQYRIVVVEVAEA